MWTRDALLLRFQQDMSFEEMAEICAEKPGTLQARVARALPQLRERIEILLADPDRGGGVAVQTEQDAAPPATSRQTQARVATISGYDGQALSRTDTQEHSPGSDSSRHHQ